MKLASSLCGVGLAACGFGRSSAIIVQVSGRLKSAELIGRQALVGTTPLRVDGDFLHFTKISLGGQDFEVLVDTGSSDLWIRAPTEAITSTDSGRSSTLEYAIGKANGPVKFADLVLAGYTVRNQAYLEPPKANLSNLPDLQGYIGLGPGANSVIFRDSSKSEAALPPMDRIFRQNMNTPNFLSVNLGRFGDPTDIFSGDMSIGTYLPGLESIQNKPKLPVTISQRGTSQHFTTLLDADGWIGPDGKPLEVRTQVDGIKNRKQLVAVIDTGFSLSQVPGYIADAIYSRYDGANFTNITRFGEVWTVPCDKEVLMTLKFGGESYPIHPLDATLDAASRGFDAPVNTKTCIGSFQPMRGSRSRSYDIILGMSFIRNVYALFDYGDFIHGFTDPYIQFLSTTEPAEAHQDFVTVRLNGVDTTGAQRLNAALVVHPIPSDEESTAPPTYVLVLGIIGATVVVLSLVIILFILLRRRRVARSGAYKPLSEPDVAKEMAKPEEPQQPSISQALYDPAPNYKP